LSPPKLATAVQLWTIVLSTSTSTTEPLCIVRFPGSSVPSVALGLYTGGAHCCTVLRVWQAIPGASPTEENIGDPGLTLEQANNEVEIITADDAFAYAFTPFAYSGMPVLVQEYRDGQFVDVTRDHLDLVASDAASAFYSFSSSTPNGLGYLAAWAADECNLGITGQPWDTLDQLLASDELVGPEGSTLTGQVYLNDLRSFLPKHGYCTT
jgi:hypothetical protein